MEVFDEAFDYWHRLLSSLGLVEGAFFSSDDDEASVGWAKAQRAVPTS